VSTQLAHYEKDEKCSISQKEENEQILRFGYYISFVAYGLHEKDLRACGECDKPYGYVGGVCQCGK
jgi:hypothetical protein